MAIVGTYMIVCEGASECNYLDHLNRFLATLPAPPNAMIPLRFIAVPRTIDRTTGTKIGCGGGAFNKVSKAYRSEWSNNKAYPFGIWVDSDLYVRNDFVFGAAGPAERVGLRRPAARGQFYSVSVLSLFQFNS